MRLLAITICFSLLSFYPAFAEPKPEVKDCNQSKNNELVACLAERYRHTDTFLNFLYKKTMAEINAGEQKDLRQVQRSWVNFKDKWCEYVYESIAPGAEAEIDKYYCLWKLTDDRIKELSLIGAKYINDDFSNVLYSLDEIGYHKNEVIDKLINKYSDQSEAWIEYSNYNCSFQEKYRGETQRMCAARISAQRGRQ